MDNYETAVRASHGQRNFIEPDAAALKAWMHCKTAILFHARFWGVILYEKALIKWSRDEPTLATDGFIVIINPDYFLSLTLPQRMFAVVHELAHMVLEHCELNYRCQVSGYITIENSATILQEGCLPGTLPYIPKLMNFAMDFVINALLTETKVGERHKDWLFNPNIDGSMSSVKVYRDLWDMMPPQNKQQAAEDAKEGQGGGEGSGGSGKPASGSGKPGDGPPVRLPSGTQGHQQFDGHLDPGSQSGKDPAKAAAERESKREEWKGVVSKAATAARVAGQMPGTMQRFVDAIIEPEVDWRDQLPASVARAMGGGGFDWRQPERQYISRPRGQRIFVPQRSGNGCGVIAIGADTSGSIGQPELDLVFGAISGIITQARPQRIYILWCDAKVHRVDQLDQPEDLEDVKQKGAPGGGGTKFEPVFDWLTDNDVKPDALVYITDMYGSFPSVTPHYPVIWASIGAALKAPFGNVIEIPR